MALDSGYFETGDNDMTTDDIATLLVKLYAEYKANNGGYDNDVDNDYAKAVGIAIRMLAD